MERVDRDNLIASAVQEREKEKGYTLFNLLRQRVDIIPYEYEYCIFQVDNKSSSAEMRFVTTNGKGSIRLKNLKESSDWSW